MGYPEVQEPRIKPWETRGNQRETKGTQWESDAKQSETYVKPSKTKAKPSIEQCFFVNFKNIRVSKSQLLKSKVNL